MENKKKNLLYISVIYVMLLLCIQLPSYLYGMQPPSAQTVSMVKIQSSDKIIEISLEDVQRSGAFNSLLDSLADVPTSDLILPLESYSSNIITKSFNITSPVKKSTEDLLNEYRLHDLIPIANCIYFLDIHFPQAIQKAFNERIYLLMKEIPLQEVSELQNLNHDATSIIFATPILNRLKFLLIEKSLRSLEAKKIESEYGKPAFSPNNKMIAHWRSNGVEIGKFQNNQVVVTDTIRLPSIAGYGEKIAFLNDRQLLITTEKNIFVYDFNPEGIINKQPSQELIIPDHTARPSSNLDNNNKFIALSYGDNCFLWHINEKGIIKLQPNHLIQDQAIGSRIAFYDDAIAVVSTDIDSSQSYLHVFNTDGTLNFNYEFNVTVENAYFYSHNKKCIVRPQKNRNELLIYDFNDKNNITHQKLYDGYVMNMKIILDDSTIIMLLLDHILLLDINNMSNPAKKIPIKKDPSDRGYYTFSMSQDSSIIAFTTYGKLDSMYMLINNEEKSVLNSIKNLNLYKLLLIDKMIDGVEGLPQLEAPSDIIELLKHLDLIKDSVKNPTQAAALLHLKRTNEPIANPDPAAAVPNKGLEFKRENQIQNPVRAAALLAVNKERQNQSTSPAQEPPAPKEKAPENISQNSGVLSTIKTFFSGIKYFFNLFISIITGGTTGLPG